MIYDFLQRLLALLGLLVLLPVIAIIAIWVFFEDSGKVFFLQKRVGLKGKLFSIIKFRTMTELKGAQEGRFDAGVSTRVTRIGSILRKFKLDELPQLINVVLGDMSLVGPRPEIEKWVNEFAEDWRIIHAVKPGITDPASIEYRNEEQILASAEDSEAMYREVVLPRKLAMYEDYVSNKTIGGDITILVKTLLVVITK